MKTEFEQLKEQTLRNIKLSKEALEKADKKYFDKVLENTDNFWLLDSKHISEINF